MSEQIYYITDEIIQTQKKEERRVSHVADLLEIMLPHGCREDLVSDLNTISIYCICLLLLSLLFQTFLSALAELIWNLTGGSLTLVCYILSLRPSKKHTLQEEFGLAPASLGCRQPGSFNV